MIYLLILSIIVHIFCSISFRNYIKEKYDKDDIWIICFLLFLFTDIIVFIILLTFALRGYHPDNEIHRLWTNYQIFIYIISLIIIPIFIYNIDKIKELYKYIFTTKGKYEQINKKIKKLEDKYAEIKHYSALTLEEKELFEGVITKMQASAKDLLVKDYVDLAKEIYSQTNISEKYNLQKDLDTLAALQELNK